MQISECTCAGIPSDGNHPIGSSPPWSNEDLIVEDLESCVEPYLQHVRATLEKPDLIAIGLYDMFKPNTTKAFKTQCEAHQVRRKLIPPGCTDQLQPEDQFDNALVKKHNENSFNEHIAEVVKAQLTLGIPAKDVAIDLSSSALGYVVTGCARAWLTGGVPRPAPLSRVTSRPTLLGLKPELGVLPESTSLKTRHMKWCDEAVKSVPKAKLKKQWEVCGYYKAYDFVRGACGRRGSWGYASRRGAESAESCGNLHLCKY